MTVAACAEMVPMRRKKWTIATICSAAVLAVPACNGALSPHGDQLLSDATVAYQAGNDRLVVERMDAFLEAYGNTRHAGRGYYLRGLARYRLKDLPGAKADLAAAEKMGEKGYILDAQTALGDVAYECGDMALAAEAFGRALARLEEGKPPADHAHFRLGCILQHQGRWSEADEHFFRVMHYFDGSEMARRARRRAQATAWTVQIGAFEQQANADGAARKLIGQGLPAFVRTVTEDDKLLFLVQVGRYAAYGEAAAGAAELKRHHRDAFVTTTR